MIKKGLMATLLAGFLVACAGTGLSADQQMGQLCASTDDALETALAFHSRLSEAEKQVVDVADATIVPKCEAWRDGELVATLDLVQALNQNLQNLLIVAGGLE